MNIFKINIHIEKFIIQGKVEAVIIDSSILKKYNIICFDLDGTILDDRKEISDFTINILKELYEAGCEIIIATGRSIEKARDLLRKVDFPYMIAANNGALVKSSDSQEAKLFIPLERDIAMKIVEIGDRINLYPYLHVYDRNGNCSLIVNSIKDKKEYLGSVNDISEILYYEEANSYLFDAILSVVFLDSFENVDKICSEVNSLKLNVTNHTILASKEGLMMSEFLNVEVNKGNGINKILEITGNSWDKVVSFGDDNNDESMIRQAKLGISMCNGSSFLKRHADLITERDNNCDGVAYELIKLFGGRL
ncbi:Cof-type HAD-IIB family hydrolase [Lagierella sp.]|uniref:Cof-type HAD-IIB family hydrolase n=1 Tax=Lagierella sp. TaxID=2849657 RepID=UPI0026137C2D|nr:Cof-type HAD-IIB family hydrolase [Lagierella sp.]